MTTHSIKENYRPKGLEPIEAIRQKVCQAIVTMYAEKRFYDGLDLLCSIAGWPTFRNEFYPPQEMDDWLKTQVGYRKKEKASVELIQTHPKELISDKFKTKKCQTCFRRHDPKKEYQRNNKTITITCVECGRRINKKR